MPEYDADLLVIGAGPAGLTAAQYGARANLKVLVIEQLAPGGQVLLIDVPENYPANIQYQNDMGIKIPPRTGFELARDMHDQAETFGAVFLSDTVSEIKKEGDIFTAVLTGGDPLKAPAVIMATGAEHRSLGVPGEKELTGRGVSYCATCDGPFFKNKKIIVIGGGDAACDEAQYLSRLSPHVVLVHRRDRFRAQKALAERVMRNPNIDIRFNTVVKEIKGEPAAGPIQRVSSVVFERSIGGGSEKNEESADVIFIFAGTLPRSSQVSSLGTKLDESGYIITDHKMASSVPGLYAAGDVRSGTFRQIVVAAGEGAVAAHNAAEYIDRLRGATYG